MFNKLDYSYNGEESIVHKLNPVVKIIGFILYVVICLLRFYYLLFVISSVFVFLLLLLSNLKMYRYLKIVWKAKYILIAMYVFMLHKNIGYIDMVTIYVRFIFCILYMMMIVYTTTKNDLGRGSARIVDIFNLIGFSFKKISSFFTSLYTYPSVFLDTYNEVFTSLEIKGRDFSNSTIIERIDIFFKNIKIVFEKTKVKMKSRKESMKYRLYKINVKSQYKYRNKLCIFVYIFIIVNIGILVFYILKVR